MAKREKPTPENPKEKAQPVEKIGGQSEAQTCPLYRPDHPHEPMDQKISEPHQELGALVARVLVSLPADRHVDNHRRECQGEGDERVLEGSLHERQR